MSSLFKKALAFTLKFEGGYVDHEMDLGGATNYGVTQSTYNEYTHKFGLPNRDVECIVMEEVEDIYYHYYWLPSKAGQMTPPLGFVHFDTAVMSGVFGATQFLQEALGLEPDGIWGKQTDKEFKANNNVQTAVKYCDRRIDYRHTRVEEDPSQVVFLDGWLARDRKIKDIIKRGY